MSDQEDDWNATYYDDLSGEDTTEQYKRIVERIESEINIQEKKPPNFLLFVLVHGHNGTPNDLNVIKSELYNQFQNSILVLSSSSNSFSNHGGIEVAGKNLACEIVQFLMQVKLIGAKSFAKQKYSRWKLSVNEDKENENPIFTQTSDDCDAKKETILFNGLQILSSGENVSQFSVVFIGHGSGGLYIRNCIGWLFEFGYFQNDEQAETNKAISCNPPPLFPLSLYTISTPHLGRRPAGGPTIKWHSMFSGMLSRCSQTDHELLLDDGLSPDHIKKQARSKPLLSEMTEPNTMYMKALHLFKCKTLIGFPHCDPESPLCSSSLIGHNPYSVPKYQSRVSVAGHSNFSDAHEKIINLFSDEIGDMDNGSRVKRNRSKSFSILGIDHQSSTYSTDTRAEIEYFQSMMKNLNSLSWRRLDLELPRNDLPFFKSKKSSEVAKLLCQLVNEDLLAENVEWETKEALKSSSLS